MAGSPYGSKFGVSATRAAFIAHFLGISAITLMLVWILHFRGGLTAKPNTSQRFFNLHPFLMLLGLIFLGGEAIMAYKTVAPPVQRRTQKLVHMLLHMAALALGIWGVVSIFQFHDRVGKPHLYTLHSWIGLATISLYALQLWIGFFSFWYPQAAMPMRADMVPWHSFVGVVIFLMAVATAAIGLSDRFLLLSLIHGKEAILVNFVGVAILLFAIATVFTVTLPAR